MKQTVASKKLKEKILPMRACSELVGVATKRDSASPSIANDRGEHEYGEEETHRNQNHRALSRHIDKKG